ncbi:hypothetical protein UXO69_05125 [Enterobacter hormaechei]
MKLYKYMKSEYAETFLKNGTLRIGTLMDFKKNENFNEAIGDKNEGSHFPQIDFQGKTYTANLNNSQKSFLKGALELPSGSFMSGFSVVREITSKDFYVYCLTIEPSRKAMDVFECDTCIEISNPLNFLSLLTKKVSEKSRGLSWHGPVSYLDKHYQYDNDPGYHPATTKDIKYSYQKEYRFIWHSRMGSNKDIVLEPFYIKVPKAIKQCRIIRL